MKNKLILIIAALSIVLNVGQFNTIHKLKIKEVKLQHNAKLFQYGCLFYQGKDEGNDQKAERAITLFKYEKQLMAGK